MRSLHAPALRGGPAALSVAPSRLCGPVSAVRSVRCTRCSAGPDKAQLAAQLAAVRAENARLKGLLGESSPGAAPSASAGTVRATAPPAPRTRAAPRAAPQTRLPPVVWPQRGEEFWLRPPRALPAPAAARGLHPHQDPSPLHVVHLTCELAPWAKVGGLADVVAGLSRACLARGHAVEVVLPFYSSLDASPIEELTHLLDFDVPKGRTQDGQFQLGSLRTSAYGATIAGVPVVLLRPAESHNAMFRGCYGTQGGTGELEASLYLCRAALEFLCVTGRAPDVLHLHEWQTSAAAMLYWETFQGCLGSRILLTIHNADSKGECKLDEFAAAGCEGAPFMTLERALDERTIGHNPERMCLLKGGVVFANAVTTVSRTYRDETTRGGWMGAVLAANAAKYQGIVNGIDSDSWDPSCDAALPVVFDASSWREGKAAMKRYVQEGLGLAVDPSTPLVIAVSRLVAQKGIGMLEHAAHRCGSMGAQFVLLGTGSQDGSLRHLSSQPEFRDGPSARLLLFYNEQLSHLLFAAADMIVVPSLFEPCGLTQMVGQRYGAVPLVRRTGGLADTVADGETGFAFDGADAGAFEASLSRALSLYREQPEQWAQMVQRCMLLDNSWDRVCEDYIQLYRSL